MLITPLGRWLLALLILVTAACGEPPKPIDTFAGNCEAILTPPTPGFLGSTKARFFAPEPIRSDFVGWYDSVLVADVAENYLGGTTPQDPAVHELHRLQMIGVWRVGHHLHIANALLFSPEDSVSPDVTYAGWTAEFRRNLGLEDSEELNPLQRCLYGTINGYFEKITIHGPDSDSLTIPAAYYMKADERYNPSPTKPTTP